MNNFLLPALFFCMLAISCSKNSTNPANTTTTTTTVTGVTFICWNKMAGDITNFQSTNNKYLERWDFGDGDTLIVTGGVNSSFGPQNHIYKAPGIYKVTLTVGGDISHQVTQVDTILPNYWFYTTGTPIMNDTLFFHFKAFLPPTGVSYLWAFGDGTTSTDSIPYHIYHSSGDFIVKLTINGNPADPDIWTKISIYNDPVYTLNMTNMRLWHGTEHKYNPYDSVSYNVRDTLADQSFALSFVDEVTVAYSYSNCIFDPSLSHGDVIAFSNGSTKIYYNHIKDSLVVYTYSIFGGLGTPPTANETWWRSP